MKKCLLISALLSLSLLMQGMETNNKLAVRMGGYSGYGARDYQEDRFVCGVIKNNKNNKDNNENSENNENNENKIYCTLVADGHSGDKVACLLKDRFLPFVQAGVQSQKKIKDSLFYAAEQCEALALENDVYRGSGSTVLASCFDEGNNELHVLWVGDSRAVYGGNKFFATFDHKPTEEHEKERIEKARNKIDEKSGKLQGLISVSRSIGDFEIKSRVASLSSAADCRSYQVVQGNGFYIGASDGFWDVVKNDEVAYLISEAKFLSEDNFYQKHCNRWGGTITQDLVTQNNQHIEITNTFEDVGIAEVAKKLVHVALCRGSRDNITVVVKLFGEQWNEFSEGSGDESFSDGGVDLNSCLEELNAFSQGDASQQADLIDGDNSGVGELELCSNFESPQCIKRSSKIVAESVVAPAERKLAEDFEKKEEQRLYATQKAEQQARQELDDATEVVKIKTTELEVAKQDEAALQIKREKFIKFEQQLLEKKYELEQVCIKLNVQAESVRQAEINAQEKLKSVQDVEQRLIGQLKVAEQLPFVSDKEGNSSTSSSELESFEFPEPYKVDGPVITQAYWKVFMQNHTYKIGGCMAAMLAIIVAAYKYNYLHLNYMVV